MLFLGLRAVCCINSALFRLSAYRPRSPIIRVLGFHPQVMKITDPFRLDVSPPCPNLTTRCNEEDVTAANGCGPS